MGFASAGFQDITTFQQHSGLESLTRTELELKPHLTLADSTTSMSRLPVR